MSTYNAESMVEVKNKQGYTVGAIVQRVDNGRWYAIERGSIWMVKEGREPVIEQHIGGGADSVAEAACHMARLGAPVKVHVGRQVGSHCTGVVEIDGIEVHRTRAFPYGFDGSAYDAAKSWSEENLRR